MPQEISNLTRWFFEQGVLGVMLLISITLNWFLVKTAVGALKDNTIALTSLKVLKENSDKKINDIENLIEKISIKISKIASLVEGLKK